MLVLVIVSIMCIYIIRRERVSYLDVKRKIKRYER